MGLPGPRFFGGGACRGPRPNLAYRTRSGQVGLCKVASRLRSGTPGCSDYGPQLARAGRERCRSRSEALSLVPAGNGPATPHETPTAAYDVEHFRSGAVSRRFSQSVLHFGCGAKASLLCKQASADGFQPGRSPIAETTRGGAPPSLCKKFGAKPHHRNKPGRSPTELTKAVGGETHQTSVPQKQSGAKRHHRKQPGRSPTKVTKAVGGEAS